jgi:ATP/maltotriose-dependent transcriptional regulator MalT
MSIANETGEERYALRAAVLKVTIDVFRAGGDRRGMDVAKRSISDLERLGDAAGLARAWRFVMYAEANQGHVDEASAAAARVIEYAGQAGDRRLASRSAPPIVAFLLHGSATVAVAAAKCEELLDITQGDRKTEAVILGTLAVLRAMDGRFDEARALYRRAQATLNELGTGIDAHSTSIDSARVERLAGDPRTAELELRRDYGALEALGETYLRSTVAACLAEVLFLNGDLVGANAFSTITEQIADPEDVEPQVKWRMVRARVLAASDASVSAVRLASEGANLAAATSDQLLRADAMADLGEVFLAVGDPESSGPPLREALSLYEQKGDIVSSARLRERLGLVVAG